MHIVRRYNTERYVYVLHIRLKSGYFIRWDIQTLKDVSSMRLIVPKDWSNYLDEATLDFHSGT